MSERQKVEAWRMQVLLDAGFSVAQASALAANPGVDLHEAVALVAAGCPHDVAVRILL